MPKISVLIPIYNTEKYLRECLESVMHQTLSDIEIICVEDASTDASLSVLQELAAEDERISILRHETNLGLFRARKDAVLCASGEYIMFLDSDDYLSPDACECLYEIITREGVDFLQFGTELLNTADMSKEHIDWVEDFMRPHEGKLSGDMLKALFQSREFNCNLVNKIWKAEICKRAYRDMPDAYFLSAEDRYASFVLTYYAKSYFGLDRKFYHYRLGTGVTGDEHLDLLRFTNRCAGAKVIDSVKVFLVQKDALEKYRSELESLSDEIMRDCEHCWKHKLAKEDQVKGYVVMLRYFAKHWIQRIVKYCAKKLGLRK